MTTRREFLMVGAGVALFGVTSKVKYFEETGTENSEAELYSWEDIRMKIRMEVPIPEGLKRAGVRDWTDVRDPKFRPVIPKEWKDWPRDFETKPSQSVLEKVLV